MITLLRRLIWSLRGRRKDEELREELEFHLEQEAEERRADGISDDEARWRARRDLGNVTLLKEETRTLWTWALVEQLGQDVRYALRTMVKAPAFTALIAASLALGIGANSAIYSFMDAILMRSLPVPDPASLVVVQWRSKPFAIGAAARNGSEFVLHAIDGRTYRDAAGVTAGIFPFPAFEQIRLASVPVLSSLFAYHPTGRVNVMVGREAELADGLFVTGDFFRGLAIRAAAGRLIEPADDRVGAPTVAVISLGYAERRFGGAASAVGQSVVIDNEVFTVAGVAPSGFFGVDPGEDVDVYLPMHVKTGGADTAQNHYWLQMMGRVRPGVSAAQAEAALAAPFAAWVASTATNERERANLPVLHLEDGAGGLDSLRRQYSKPLYVLLAMVGLILAIACANTANLLLARATARRREMALRLSLGAGRLRVVRQLLTESILLGSLGGGLGILIAIAGVPVLTQLLANGREGFTLHADLNWHVLFVTLGLSVLSGVVFGLAPALQSTRPAVMPTLKDTRMIGRLVRVRHRRVRLNASQALVITQIALSLLLLVGAGLFVRTLSNLESIEAGFNRENVLLFEVNAPQTGRSSSEAAAFYTDLRRALIGIPGVRAATMSHASLVTAGRQLPIIVDGTPARDSRVLGTGPEFFTTMQIPVRQGREIDERDREASAPVAVVSELFSTRYFGTENPIGRLIRLGGSAQRDLEIIGVAATARYGGLKGDIPPVVYIPYAQIAFPPLAQMTYAVRTEGDPLLYVNAVRANARAIDPRIPVTNVKTQVAEIEQTINQEIVFARLCSAFAMIALVIACVGLYGTLAYTTARRTREIGVRMALGARQGTVAWMVLREVCVLAAVGLAIALPIALGASRFIESFLFGIEPNDPAALAAALGILMGGALLAGYGPARKASRISPMTALRHD